MKNKKLLYGAGALATLAIGGVAVFILWRVNQQKSVSKSTSGKERAQELVKGNSQIKPSVVDRDVVKQGLAEGKGVQQDKEKQSNVEETSSVESSSAQGIKNMKSSKGGNSEKANDRGLATNQIKDAKKEIKPTDNKKGPEDNKKSVAENENGSQGNIGNPLKPKNDEANNASNNGGQPNGNDSPPGINGGSSSPVDVTVNSSDIATNNAQPENSNEPPKPRSQSEIVGPFRSFKQTFIDYLGEAIFSSPDETKLKESFDKVKSQLANALKETPAFADTEYLSVTSALSLEDFVRAYFTSKLDDIIRIYDGRLIEKCMANEAEYEEYFKAWLAWTKGFKIDLTGRASPEWITFSEYSHAKTW